MKWLFALFLWVTLINSVTAQNDVSGIILDSITQEPVPYANVYFANTSVGTYSSEDGKYTLKNFPDGKYDLTVSFVGYLTSQISLEFSSTKKSVNFLLSPKTTQLTEVVISPDTSHRESNLRQFFRNFIGETENSKSCVVMNRKDIFIDYDVSTGLLSAVSRKPIVIENRALGYRVFYDLQIFEADYIQGSQLYLGIPRFEDLEPKNKAQFKRWEKERARAYFGSFGHFISLMKQGSWGENFVVYRLYRVKNAERPSTEFLNKQIARLQRKYAESPFTVTRNSLGNDSLSYYVRLKRKPELIDSLGSLVKAPSALLDSTHNTITYTGMLRIVYKKEPEESRYAIFNNRAPGRGQHSTITILAPIRIYENGYYEDVRDIFFEGYMGWSEKISELLPLEYLPPRNGVD
jgi:CarboxypepD_reg-like domain